ncbi:protein mono-ADP-ribosyltransferase PARP16 [Anabrus simplex]|uniref:protein mono-ADP-ribosyltransferase PARP16 n=1 Tax=Anabrus simplex TaxID=316456 RepID=UPI0034DDC363
MQGDRSKTLSSSSATVHRPPNATDGIDVATQPSKSPSLADRKVVALRSLLERDPRAADIKWSLFIAACQSYRYDSCLKPFPPQYLKNDNKDIDSLREVVDKTPALSLLIRHLQDPDVYQTSSDIVDLVYWVLVHFKDTRIKSIPKDQFNNVLSHVQCETAVQPPNFIFQITSGPRSIHETKWMQLARGRKTLYAFHGSRLENFHSILHHGLQQHMNKNSLFGRGIYLSSELSVSLPYSPMGYAWGRSLLGSQLSCIALCEMINHPDVKCQDEESGPSRSITTDSIGGEVPKKYFVVLNSDLVRVRYLLVYSKHFQGASTSDGSVLGWLGSHKLLTFIISYVVLLATIGLSNNHYVQRYYKMLLHRAGLT